MRDLTVPQNPGVCPIEPAPVDLGAVYTRPEVVAFMLDDLGLTATKDWSCVRLLEPSCGDGAFLVEVARRAGSWAASGPSTRWECLDEAVVGVEIDYRAAARAVRLIAAALLDVGADAARAAKIAACWVRVADFLDIWNTLGDFTHVVGNPPYIRIESIAASKLADWRARFPTMTGRADIYVAFYEACLRTLRPEGRLSFICANRWMKAAYGRELRRFISANFAVERIVDLPHTDCFAGDVCAYPAITVIGGVERRLTEAQVLEAGAGPFDRTAIERSVPCMLAQARFGVAPWVVGSFDRLALAEAISARFPSIEAAGCRVGVGVATGADAVYVGLKGSLPVESDRRVPFVSRDDISGRRADSARREIINVFSLDGSLVDLCRYPRLKAYLRRHEVVLRARHVARKAPARWYRTIDRINPAVVSQEKILVCDIAPVITMAIGARGLCPDHNLYTILTDRWPIEALFDLLSSGLADLYASLNSVQMRGGSYRFQAQTIRLIHIPEWDALSPALRAAWTERAWTERAGTEQAGHAPSRRLLADTLGLSLDDVALLASCAEARRP